MPLLIEKSNPRILVADDDSVIRHLVCSAVRSEGYEVVVAEDEIEALRIFKMVLILMERFSV